jgi:hypothetical protein
VLCLGREPSDSQKGRERLGCSSGRSLLELDLLEIGPTLKGDNPETRIITAKSSASTGGNSTFSYAVSTTAPESEIERLSRRLDQLASNERPRSPELARQVDDLIVATRLELVQEALDRAEQVAWERRTYTNLVLDPVPVRVDPMMRPVTG